MKSQALELHITQPFSTPGNLDAATRAIETLPSDNEVDLHFQQHPSHSVFGLGYQETLPAQFIQEGDSIYDTGASRLLLHEQDGSFVGELAREYTKQIAACSDGEVEAYETTFLYTPDGGNNTLQKTIENLFLGALERQGAVISPIHLYDTLSEEPMIVGMLGRAILYAWDCSLEPPKEDSKVAATILRHYLALPA